MTRRVLLVDDNEDVLLLLREILAPTDVEAFAATNGREAISRVLELLPDLVILDAQMPEMDGWDTLRFIRSDPRTVDIAVIMCTVKGRLPDVMRGWELGCDGFVGKPFDIDDLLAEIDLVTARTPSQRVEARQAALEDLALRMEALGDRPAGDVGAGR